MRSKSMLSDDDYLLSYLQAQAWREDPSPVVDFSERAQYLARRDRTNG